MVGSTKCHNYHEKSNLHSPFTLLPTTHDSFLSLSLWILFFFTAIHDFSRSMIEWYIHLMIDDAEEPPPTGDDDDDDDDDH